MKILVINGDLITDVGFYWDGNRLIMSANLLNIPATGHVIVIDLFGVQSFDYIMQWGNLCPVDYNAMQIYYTPRSYPLGDDWLMRRPKRKQHAVADRETRLWLAAGVIAPVQADLSWLR